MVTPTATELRVLEVRLRNLYQELNVQQEVIGVLRAEIIKHQKRIERLEAVITVQDQVATK